MTNIEKSENKKFELDHVNMDDVATPEQAVEWLNRIRARKQGFPFEKWVTLEDIKISESAKEGDELGFVNCSCGRVHQVILRNCKKHVDTGWY